MNIKFDFISPQQAAFVHALKRNTCFSGGYGNGKTFTGCLKVALLMAKFKNYRVAICRRKFSDLTRTTMSTFFKLCPPALYDPRNGGKRTDSLGKLRLVNGSEIFWLHLEDYDDSVVRGLEVDSVLVDQAEEISEHIYLHLAARVGRWDQAIVPDGIDTQHLARHKLTGKPVAPAYMMLLCNPDTKDHWIYKRYHPDSPAFQEKYHHTHLMIQSASTDNPLLDAELVEEMKGRGRQFNQRFVQGIWGNAGGAIHQVDEMSILRHEELPSGFLEMILSEGRLIRVMDHGDASPTCVLWFCMWNEYVFCYREYYQAATLISEHRKNISDLSINPFTNRHERYFLDLADPAIFKKTAQKQGGWYTVAEEYTDQSYEEKKIHNGKVITLAPPIFWNPADNSEFLCRSRLNELLKPREGLKHPFLPLSGSPSLFFIHKSPDIPHGVHEGLYQIMNQKYKKIDNVDGNDIYSDERGNGVDHAYDCVRYFAGHYHNIVKEAKKPLGERTFSWYQKKIKRSNRKIRLLN